MASRPKVYTVAAIQVVAAWIASSPVSVCSPMSRSRIIKRKHEIAPNSPAAVVLWCSAPAAQRYLISTVAGGAPPHTPARGVDAFGGLASGMITAIDDERCGGQLGAGRGGKPVLRGIP